MDISENMLDLEKLIKALEAASRRGKNNGLHRVELTTDLVDVFILPMLRSFLPQPARLLSMEEAAATQGAGAVWVERLTKEPVISLYIYESSDGFAFVNPDDFNVEYQKDFFNRSWRVWDRRPRTRKGRRRRG